MMHSIKSQSPLKHDLKLGVDKFCDKISEGNGSTSDLINKCSNSSTQLQVHSSKLIKKNSNFKSKFAFKVGNQTKLNKSYKREKEPPSSLSNKKMKCDYDFNKKTTKLQAKKQKNISKSVYYKDNASYVCKFCCRRFSSVEQLKEHTFTHGNKSSYVCHICNHEAACFSALMTHVVKHSRKSDRGNSTNCDNNVSTPEKIISSFQCNHCKLNFATSLKLSNHSCPSLSFEKSEYMCAYCGQISTSVEEYRSHVQSHSVTPFMCPHCKLKLPTKKHFDRHYEVCKKKPKLKFKCENCSFACKGKRELNQHIKKCKSNTELQIFCCSSCKLSFPVKSEFDIHILNCNVPALSPNNDSQSIEKKDIKIVKKDSYVCDTCGRTFTSKIGYGKHKEKCWNSEKTDRTKESNLMFVFCPTCNIQIDSLLLEEHMKSCCSLDYTKIDVESPNEHCDGDVTLNKHSDSDVTPSKNSGSEMSPSKNSGDEESPNTRRSARLVGRKIVFSSEEEFKVKETYKPKQFRKFKVVEKLRNRKGRQSKLGKENFMCFECNLTFCSKSTLLRHKRMHSGNPWYSCQYCGKFFFRKDVFNRHEMNVHNKSNKNIFCCYYCKLFFNAPVLLKEHVYTVHKENSLFTKSSDALSSDEIEPHIQVKQETCITESDEANQSKDIRDQFAVELSSSKIPNFPYKKKCGICSQTFLTISEIEEHLATHPVPNPKDCDSSDKDTPSSPLKVPSLEINLKTVFSDEHTTDTNVDNCNNVTDGSETLLKDSGKLSTNDSSLKKLLEIPSKSVEEDKYLCKLCFKSFSDKTTLSKHEAEQHLIIDWYQCLICDTCGSKQEMIEHMFSHMYQVGTFVVAKNDFSSVLSFLQQSEVEIQKQRVNSSISEIESNDKQCESTELDVDDIELPKLTYFGDSNLETEVHPKTTSEDLISLEPNQEVALEKISSNVSKGESVKVSACIEPASSDKNSSSENMIDQEIPVASTSSTLHGDSGEHLNDKDPFQELRRILKADNIPLKEVSMGSDISSKNDICNKTSNEEENSSDAQNYSQLRYLLEKNDKKQICDKTTVNQYVECTKEHEVASGESTENSYAVTSMRNLIQDLKSLNKLVSENVTKDTIEEINFNSFNEINKTIDKKLNETHSESIKKLNETDKVSVKKLGEADKLNVKKLSEIDDLSIKKLNDTVDLNVKVSKDFDKVTFMRSNEPDNIILKNRNEANKFSFKSSHELDSNISKNIVEGSKSILKCNHAPDKNVFKNINEANKFIFKSKDELDKMISKSKNDVEKFSFNSKSEADKGMPLNLNPAYNTCLKFDVNQSRGEFSETSSFQQNSLEVQKLDKLNYLFQSTNPQSTILDFSDLLKISDNTNTNENIFEISSQSNELCDNSSNIACTSANISHKIPVDLTFPAGCTSKSPSKEEFKCNKCAARCKSYNELTKHKCVKSLFLFEEISPTTPKIKPLPFDFSKTTFDNCSNLNKKKQIALENPKHRSTTIFMCCVCSKIVKTSSILEQHYRAEHSGYSNNSFPNNKCIQCCQVLYGIADFMKHSLNCLKSNNSTLLDESSRRQGLLQSLLLKPGSQAHEKSIASSNVSQTNDIASYTYDSILNLSQNSFNS